MDKWNCATTEKLEKLTVGKKFTISCKGSEPLIFNENIKIIFPQKKDSYRLYVLKTLKKKPQSLDLQVVSYRTGIFDMPFVITDGENSVSTEGLFFSVESVLSNNSKPHPPFGPWQNPWPLWYLSAWGLSFFLLLAASFFFGRIFFKRKSFIEKINYRRGTNSPSKNFAKNLRKKDTADPEYIKKLEKLFKIFLEELLLIPARKKNPSVILRSLKKYNKILHKSHGKKLETLLNEMEEFKNKKIEETLSWEIQRNSLNLAFELEERVK